MLSNPNYSVWEHLRPQEGGLLHQNPGPLLLKLVSPTTCPGSPPAPRTAPSASIPVPASPSDSPQAGTQQEARELRKAAHGGKADEPSKQNQGVKGAMTMLASHSAAAIGIPMRAESWPAPQGLACLRWTPSTGPTRTGGPVKC